MPKIVEYTSHLPVLSSSAVKKVWYSAPTRELYVEVPSGAKYGYRDVSPVAFDKFMDASSKGAFYNKHIKGVYSSTGDLSFSGVEFRAAPGLSKKSTEPSKYTAGGYVSASWPATNVTGSQVNPVVPKATSNSWFVVRGEALLPSDVSKKYAAGSLEEAMEMFRKEFEGKEPSINEVKKV